MALEMQSSGRTGWYYRTLTPGWVRRGAEMAVVDRPHPDWPLARVIALMFARDKDRLDEWALAAKLPALADRWRHTFGKRVAEGKIEDWTQRLQPPPR